jgi:archaellum biogenesis ATPase FlaH
MSPEGGSPLRPLFMEFKVKPETVTVEDALIVSLWHDPNLLSVVPHLTERHFPTWGVVFKHIKEAFLNGYRPIISLLPTTLQFPFAELLDKVPPMDEAEVKVAAEQLVRQQTLSLLKRLGEMVARKASDGADPSYLIGVISHYIGQTVKWMGLEFKPFPTLIEGYLKWLTGAEQDANVVGSFGLPTLDEKIGQLRAGMLVTVLAPTGGGKTSFAVQTALNSALQNHPVAFFSLEMTEEQLMTRMVAHLTSLPSFALWTRRIGSSPDDLKKIEDLRDMGLPIYLARDTWTLDDVLRAIVTAKLRFGCRLVIVDYLQKIIAPQQERRELEVAMVAKELKRYALQQEVAVVALSQVNTEREGRARESRVIEHESDVMLFLKASEFGRVKIEVRKNRMGESGHIIEADFNAELCRFNEVGERPQPTSRSVARPHDDNGYGEQNDPTPTHCEPIRQRKAPRGGIKTGSWHANPLIQHANNPLIQSAKRGDNRLMGEKVVLLVLKDDMAKWVDDLRKRTRMSDEEVIEGALYLLRIATSTELGQYYVAQALKASGFFMDATDKNKIKGCGGH